MPRKLKKSIKAGPRDLASTVEELVTTRAQAEKNAKDLGLAFQAVEVWLGPRERAGLLAVIMERAQRTREPDLVAAVLRGDPEGTTLMGLTVRSMTRPGVRVGITYGA